MPGGERPSRWRRFGAPVLLASILLAAAPACGDDTPRAPTATTTPAPQVEEDVGDGAVPLSAPAPALRGQCEDAAAQLGYAVPCPGRLPLVGGSPVDCGDRCTAVAGGDETLDNIFFLDVSGYDGEESADAVRHLVVEARRVERAPPSPCHRGAPDGHDVIAGRRVDLLECPARTPAADREIRHGEAAHLEHRLVWWDEGGIRYAVSVHGSSTAHRALLDAVVASIELVGTR